jgi:hypothetical protein
MTFLDKPRTYLKIKTNFGYENYLSIIKNFEQRRRLSKLRISAHKLQIEIGRYDIQQRASRDDAKNNIFFLMLNAGHPVCRSPTLFNQIVVDKRY